MGFSPGTMALGLGVAHGISGFMGGQSQADAARTNAAINRQWAIFAKNKSLNDILRIQAEEKRQKVKQNLANNSILGRFQASIGGASGVTMEGSTMDAMSGQVEMAWNKMQNITAQSLVQQAGAENLGNQQAWKYTVGAGQYEQQAGAAESASWMALGTGALMAGYGATAHDADYFSGWWGA